MDEVEAAQEVIGKALADHAAAISRAEGGLVSEWVVVVGVIDEEGEGWVSMLTSPGLLITHRKGLLHEALHGGWQDE